MDVRLSTDTTTRLNPVDWKFPVANGSVTVRLTSTSSTDDGKAVYALQIIDGSAAPSVVDEAAFLKAVTVAMQSEGMSPT